MSATVTRRRPNSRRDGSRAKPEAKSQAAPKDGITVRHCEHCGVLLLSGRRSRRFCSDSCRNRAWCKNHPRARSNR